jgi:hypothetical protein
MNRLGRASAIAIAVSLGSLLSACYHEGEDTVVGSNGTADMVLTETLSPVVWASGDVYGLTPATPAKTVKEVRASPLPGQDSVRVYTDSDGWKGVQIRCTFHSLPALDAIEIAKPGQDNSTGLFSSFSIKQTGSQWVLDAKVDVPEITDIFALRSGKKKGIESGAVTRADMAQIGIEISVSFRLPGKIISDNATSVGGSVMTWNLLGQVYKLHAVTTSAAQAGLSTRVGPTLLG